MPQNLGRRARLGRAEKLDRNATVVLGGSCEIVSSSYWVVVSNIFYVHPYLGKISNLTNIFQMG